MKYCYLLLCVVLCFVPELFATAPDTEFTGTFDLKLVPQTADFWDIDLMSPKDAAKVKFATPPGPSEKMVAGYLYDPFQDRLAILFALVAPDGAPAVLYVDVNHNKVLEANERFDLSTDRRPGFSSALVELPTKDSHFHSFPLLVGFARSASRLIVWQTKFASILGTVKINGRNVKVAFTYNPLTKSVFINQRWWGIDSNGDGKVDLGRMSSESAFSYRESKILKAGDVYVAAKRADLEKNEIVLVERPATNYSRIDLVLGQELPDFSFEGLGKKKQTLSGLRGNYVLLYFWGPFCEPCRPDFPVMREAYSNFHARGFEIIGVYRSDEADDDMRSLHANFPVVPAGNASAWVKQFYLRSSPTVLLLDKEGRIISRGLRGEGEPGLRGGELLNTLRKLLP